MHTILKTPNLFPGIWGNLFEQPVPSARNSGSVGTNIQETESGLKIQICIPGFSKEQIQLEVDQNRILKIEGKIGLLENAEKILLHKNDFCVRDFTKQFKLGEGLNGEEIHASYENGILTITVPKTMREEKSRPGK